MKIDPIRAPEWSFVCSEGLSMTLAKPKSKILTWMFFGEDSWIMMFPGLMSR